MGAQAATCEEGSAALGFARGEFTAKTPAPGAGPVPGRHRPTVVSQYPLTHVPVQVGASRSPVRSTDRENVASTPVPIVSVLVPKSRCPVFGSWVSAPSLTWPSYP